MAVQAVSTYTQQLNTKDWRVAMAEVTDVSMRRERRSGGVKSRSHYIITVYDITYQYWVNNDSYTGQITGSPNSKAVGDRFDIKYDPVFSENSTHMLEPQTDVLIFNLFGSCLFAAVGMWASGLLPPLLQAIRRLFGGQTAERRENSI
ncbi:MAG: hypothetical protein PUB37_05345 [Firmicutes bacterium]|nr:hypothetical protein [Bacillota bacterium]